MNYLHLGDFEGYTQEEVMRHVATNYFGCDVAKGLPDVLNTYEILVAFECSDWMMGTSYFLLLSKEGKGYFEVRAGHCSCYGFEGQFEPEETCLEYLTSPNFWKSMPVNTEYNNVLRLFISKL